MKYRKLGNSGLKVSNISLGSMFFGGAQFQATDNPVTIDEAQAVIHRALELEINYLDCADIYGAYGTAEKIIGETIKGHDREHILLSSKLMMPMSYNEFDRGLSRKHIRKSIKRTLDNFQTDYVDLYYAHRYDPYTSVEELVRSMNNLIDEGLILHWATSNWAAAELERMQMYAKSNGFEGPIVDQTKYHPLRRYPTEVSLPFTLDEYNMGLVSYGILCDGLFSGLIKSINVDDLTDEEKGIINDELPRGWTINQALMDSIQGYYELAKSLDISPAQMTYAWALQAKRVNTVLMSTRKVERLDENVAMLDITLDNDTLTRINELFPGEYREFDSYVRVTDNPNRDIIGRIPEDMMRF